ncbi:SDR family oxidoreductase [Mycobacterium sp. M1]|uniref:SDR family oxidoreductase n=1 Tax=Mycolicibacter acidiphilus TaxID=2835306 RepID=A0ABS5RJL5_9MYCO|nr:SDR family oxidoreductase [Mycolicibacter acidiphilus]MBS9534490.1 SDR family oxidoreductase [Mycolicibacter acidiphilus]
MDRIRGKNIVITGAARGIGRATAEALLARGARVVIGDRDVDVLDKAIAELNSRGQVTGHPLDVTDRASFSDFLDKARADGGGRIDVLINNAGVMPVGPFLDQSTETLRSAIEVNLYGVLNGCQLVLPEMVARGSGHIVNIASVAGLVAVPGQVVYAATKFGVVGLTTALSDEFAPRGVDVSAVLPTFTNTELISGTTAVSKAQQAVEPADIAAGVVKVLTKPKTQLSVPGSIRSTSILAMLLPDRGRRWLSRKLGNDTVFLNLDTEARRAYEDRAQHATGVVEHRD